MTTNNADLEKAFVRLQQSLLNYLRSRLPDSSLADDLLQDVFLKALVSQQRGTPIKNISAWLYSITRNTLIDWYRSKSKFTDAIDESLLADSSDESMILTELSTCLRPIINQLPALYRDTLLATELEGISMRKVAEKQGVSVSAIKSRAARGRALLKQKLQACCVIEVQQGVAVDYYNKHESGCGGTCG